METVRSEIPVARYDAEEFYNEYECRVCGDDTTETAFACHAKLE
jgi:hypothetical protein